MHMSQVEGFARVQQAFDPTSLAGEGYFPATQAWGYPITLEDQAPPQTTIFMQELGSIAVAAEYPGWEPNRFMFKFTAEGWPEHADRTSFRDFIVLAYLKGRTDMFVRPTDTSRYRGLILNPGDVLVLREAKDPTDHESPMRHGVRASGFRGFLGVAYEEVARVGVHSLAGADGGVLRVA